jgi:hypothetical protein
LKSAFGWENIVIVEPNVIIYQGNCSSLEFVDKIKDINIFLEAVSLFKIELKDYLVQIPVIKSIKAPDGFYEKLEAESEDFLKRFIMEKNESLLISSNVQIDCSDETFEVEFMGFDINISGGLLYSVIQAPVSLKDVYYLEELYIQSLFEVLNEDMPFQ